MALYSLIVEHLGNSYSTQLCADSARQVIKQFFARVYPKTRAAAFGKDAPILGANDIIYVTPMEGLTNLWLACAGRKGRYVSVVCARTGSRRAA